MPGPQALKPGAANNKQSSKLVSHRKEATSEKPPAKKPKPHPKKHAKKKNKTNKTNAAGGGVETIPEDEEDDGDDDLLVEAPVAALPPSNSACVEADAAEEQAKAARDKGRLDEAARLYRTCLQLRRTLLGDRHAQTISTIDALGAVLYMEADLAGAEVLLLEALQLRRETLGDKHPDTIHSISNTGMLLKDKRDFVGAEELLSEAVTAMRESTDEAASSAQGQGSSSSSSSLLICQSNLGTLYKDKGDLVKAEEMLRETLNEMRKSLGDRHPATLSALVQLGLVLLEKRELIGAEELLTEALTANREIFVSGHPQLLASITWLAGLHETKGDIAAALPLHQEVLSGFSAANHPMTHRCASHVAALLRQQGREAEAEAVLSEYGVSLAAPAVALPPQPVTHAPSSEEPQGIERGAAPTAAKAAEALSGLSVTEDEQVLVT